MKTKIIMLLLVLGSWGAFAQHDHHAHKSEAVKQEEPVAFKDAKLGKAYSQYLRVKDALVSSKGDDAKREAGELVKALKEVNGATAALSAAGKIAASAELKEQRVVFSTLSDEMAKLVKGGKLTSGSLYLEYCPMANSNAGAYWLSNEKEIKNPYFGDMMLKCGSVKETIQ